MATTKDKLEFVHAMARRTRATVRQCEALMRYGATLLKLHDIAPHGLYGVLERVKRDRIQRKVTELCGEITGNYAEWSKCTAASNRLADLVCLMYHPRDPKARQTWPTATWAEIIAEETSAHIPDSDNPACIPLFAGAVLKIRVPDGEEIVCPS